VAINPVKTCKYRRPMQPMSINTDVPCTSARRLWQTCRVFVLLWPFRRNVGALSQSLNVRKTNDLLYLAQWLNSAGTGRNGVPPPVSGVPPPTVVVPPPGNDVPSPFEGKSLKLLPPEVRF